MNTTASFTEYLGVISRCVDTDGTVELADTPPGELRVKAGNTVGVGFSAAFTQPYGVQSVDTGVNHIRLRFTGVGSREQAAGLVDMAVFAKPGSLQAAADAFRVADIIGCWVYQAADNEAGKPGDVLGTVEDVLLLPANDVWVVRTPAGTEILLPVIDEVIQHVDVIEKKIIVTLLDGLLNTSVPDPDE